MEHFNDPQKTMKYTSYPKEGESMVREASPNGSV